MARGLKEMIEKKLGNILNEKGFYYDKSVSNPRVLIIYAKGEAEPEDQWYLHDNPPPKREEIRFSRSGLFPEISVLLRSLPKKDVKVIDLGHLSGSPIEKWWPIRTKEEMEKSIDEIGELLQKYAWDWFVLD